VLEGTSAESFANCSAHFDSMEQAETVVEYYSKGVVLAGKAIFVVVVMQVILAHTSNLGDLSIWVIYVGKWVVWLLLRRFIYNSLPLKHSNNHLYG